MASFTAQRTNVGSALNQERRLAAGKACGQPATVASAAGIAAPAKTAAQVR
jgi:hypothetical protein